MNFKVTNTKTGAILVVDQHGVDGLIASHTAQMSAMTAALEASLIRQSLAQGVWESQSRGMRIEVTFEPITTSVQR